MGINGGLDGCGRRTGGFGEGSRTGVTGGCGRGSGLGRQGLLEGRGAGGWDGCGRGLAGPGAGALPLLPTGDGNGLRRPRGVAAAAAGVTASAPRP